MTEKDQPPTDPFGAISVRDCEGHRRPSFPQSMPASERMALLIFYVEKNREPSAGEWVEIRQRLSQVKGREGDQEATCGRAGAAAAEMADEPPFPIEDIPVTLCGGIRSMFFRDPLGPSERMALQAFLLEKDRGPSVEEWAVIQQRILEMRGRWD